MSLNIINYYANTNYASNATVVTIEALDTLGAGSGNIFWSATSFVDYSFLLAQIRDNLVRINGWVATISNHVANVNVTIGQDAGSSTSLSGISTTLGTMSTTLSTVSSTLNTVSSSVSSVASSQQAVAANTTSSALIEAALDQIATNTGDIAADTDVLQLKTSNVDANLARITTNFANVDINLANIRTNFTWVANLAVGEGVHTVSPWEWVSVASLYNFFGGEDGADIDYTVNAAQIANLVALRSVIEASLNPYFDPDR